MKSINVGRTVHVEFLDELRLRRTKYRNTLIESARRWAAAGDDQPTPENDELFKAMHACGKELDVRKRARPARARLSDRRLVLLYRQLRSHLFQDNIGLVYEMRRQVAATNVDPDDMLSEGLWILFRAVKSFNPWRGFRFSTYACTSIARGLRLLVKKRLRSLDLQATYFHRRPQRGYDRAEDAELDRQFGLERMQRVIGRNEAELTPTEMIVVHERFLRNDSLKRVTLADVGEKLRLSKERVRQIQIQALDKLRVALQHDGPSLCASGVG